MAIPTFVSQSTAQSGIGSVTPAAPASIASDDILLYVVETANESLPTTTGASPPNVAASDSGWTLAREEGAGDVGTDASTPGTRLFVFWKRTTGTETMPQTGDSGNHQVARAFAFRGAVTAGDPFQVTAGDTITTPATGFTCPAVTTTTADNLILHFCSSSFDGTNTVSGPANASLSNLTSLTDNSYTTSGNGGGWFGMYGELASAGSSGTGTGTFANACNQARITLALASVAASSSNSGRNLLLGVG